MFGPEVEHHGLPGDALQRGQVLHDSLIAGQHHVHAGDSCLEGLSALCRQERACYNEERFIPFSSHDQTENPHVGEVELT